MEKSPSSSALRNNRAHNGDYTNRIASQTQFESDSLRTGVGSSWKSIVTNNFGYLRLICSLQHPARPETDLAHAQCDCTIFVMYTESTRNQPVSLHVPPSRKIAGQTAVTVTMIYWAQTPPPHHTSRTLAPFPTPICLRRKIYPKRTTAS